jgi:hypothetical protein
MKTDQIALTALMGAGGRELRKSDAMPPRIGDCSIAVFSAPAGSGQTTLFEQFGTLHVRPVVTVHADPNVRTLRNEIYRAVFRDESCFWGSDQTVEKIVDELKTQGSPVLIFDNADRLANPKLLDVVRDIGDRSGSSIVLSCIRGRRGLLEMLHTSASSLMNAVSSRVARFVELPAVSHTDAQILASELSDIPFDGKVITHLFKRNGASVRSLLNAVHSAEELALTAGFDRIGVTEWSAIAGEIIEADRSIAPTRKALVHPAGTIHQAVVKGNLKTSIKVA